ncbi:hypothetical protein BLSTO_00446 [Blastocystis sp. subtype 1]
MGVFMERPFKSLAIAKMITVEFGGGMDILFHNRKKIELATVPKTVNELITYLKEKELSERPELFVDGDRLRSGILVLVNDVDWEVLEGGDTELVDGDNVLFLSTLHGG